MIGTPCRTLHMIPTARNMERPNRLRVGVGEGVELVVGEGEATATREEVEASMRKVTSSQSLPEHEAR